MGLKVPLGGESNLDRLTGRPENAIPIPNVADAPEDEAADEWRGNKEEVDWFDDCEVTDVPEDEATDEWRENNEAGWFDDWEDMELDWDDIVGNEEVENMEAEEFNEKLNKFASEDWGNDAEEAEDNWLLIW